MNRLIENLKPHKGIKFNLLIDVVGTQVNKVRLFDSIADAYQKNISKSDLYEISSIYNLNDKIARPTGIVHHPHPNSEFVISLIVDNNENTRFCLASEIEIE